MIKGVEGNIKLLELRKTVFLCSQRVPASVVLKCYDWAIEQRANENCVVSGFHSQLEKDVLHYLLKGKQPIIIALARGLKDRIEPEFQNPLDEGRLLIITPFEKHIKRVTQETATIRNKMMLELADDIVIGYANPKGKLCALINSISKPVMHL